MDSVNLNLERNKTFINLHSVSTLGFLICLSFVLLKIFFTSENGKRNDNPIVIFKEIDLNFCLSSNLIDFSKFCKISNTDMKDFYDVNSQIENKKEFNHTTKFYFIIHILIHYFLKNLDEEYVKILQQLHTFISAGKINDPQL